MIDNKAIALPHIETELRRFGRDPLEVYSQRELFLWKQEIPLSHFLFQKMEYFVNRILSWENQGEVYAKLKYHIPYWVQHLLRSPDAQLRINEDIHGSPLTKVDATTPIAFTRSPFLNFSASLIPDSRIWERYIKNSHQNYDIFRAHKGDILGLSWEDVLVLSNHITWANLPYIAFCLEYVYGIPRDRIYTFTWQAIFTNEFYLTAARHFSNLISTWADTKNADTGYEWADRIKVAAMRHTLKMLKKERSDWDKPRVFLLAPSGTSDLVKEGTVYITPPTETTLWFIQNMKDKGVRVIVIWVNDHGILTKEGELNRSDIPIKIVWPITHARESVEAILSAIVDVNGNPIGKIRENE